jgi:hypothetical protein
MRYADRDRVLAQLEIRENTQADQASVARAEKIEEGVCSWIDQELGFTFGAAAVASTRTIHATGSWDVLLLPPPGVRSVSAVTVDGVTLVSTAHRLVYVSPEGVALGIYRTDGWLWLGAVAVTGVWGDAAAGVTVPPDIREAATWLTIQEYQREGLAPTDPSGPDGFAAKPRNPYRFEVVQAAIRHHRIAPPRVAV